MDDFSRDKNMYKNELGLDSKTVLILSKFPLTANSIDLSVHHLWDWDKLFHSGILFMFNAQGYWFWYRNIKSQIFASRERCIFYFYNLISWRMRFTSIYIVK